MTSRQDGQMHSADWAQALRGDIRIAKMNGHREMRKLRRIITVTDGDTLQSGRSLTDIVEQSMIDEIAATGGRHQIIARVTGGGSDHDRHVDRLLRKIP